MLSEAEAFRMIKNPYFISVLPIPFSRKGRRGFRKGREALIDILSVLCVTFFFAHIA